MAQKSSLNEELARLKAENEALKNESLKAAQAKGSEISFKVSEKGAVSVYGLGRFPVTLYKEQWEKLLAGVDQLTAFIAANDTRLSIRGKN